MSEIFLNDILRLTDEQIKNTKLKFHTMDGEKIRTASAVWLVDKDEVDTIWLFWNMTEGKNSYRVGETVLGFIRLDTDKWLLTTIKKVTKNLECSPGVGYEGEEVATYRKYFGRLVVRWQANAGMGIIAPLWSESKIDQLELLEILPDVYDGEEFPGFENICLSYSELANIIHRHKKDWMSALSNQKAVYLITDTKTGDQYIGSATGDNGMLLQRWRQYIDNGHGDNKKLREICDDKKRGFDYIKRYFQYSVLENYNSRIDNEKILERESWWKETLGSRAFGLNCN